MSEIIQRPIEDVVDELTKLQRQVVRLQNELAHRTAVAWAVVAWPARVDGDIIVPISATYKSYAAPNGCDAEVVISMYVHHGTDDETGGRWHGVRYQANLCASDDTCNITTDRWSRLGTTRIRTFETHAEATAAIEDEQAHNQPAPFSTNHENRW